MEIKGTVALAEIPPSKRGAGNVQPEVWELIEALQAVPIGHALVASFPDVKTASARTASLKGRKYAAVQRGTSVYVSRNGTA